MWALLMTLGHGRSECESCPGKEAFWIQPHMETNSWDASITGAWCYPTAVANILDYHSQHGVEFFPVLQSH